jgi:cupin 2 domain-containing protein
VAGGIQRGRLADPSGGPARGEVVARVHEAHGLAVEHILSGRLEAPAAYDQPDDEWVVLLSGRALLEAAGERHELAPGDWLFLPARVRHRLLETEPGTSWLAVHHRARP